jgi:hypothetical protein
LSAVLKPASPDPAKADERCFHRFDFKQILLRQICLRKLLPDGSDSVDIEGFRLIAIKQHRIQERWQIAVTCGLQHTGLKFILGRSSVCAEKMPDC